MKIINCRCLSISRACWRSVAAGALLLMLGVPRLLADPPADPCPGEQTVPFSAWLSGQLLPPEESGAIQAVAIGNGNQMGRFQQIMRFWYLDLVVDGEGQDGYGEGDFVQIAANGDELFGTFAVQFVSPTQFLGYWYAHGGSGRFDGACGGGPSAGELDPATFEFIYAYSGRITRIGETRK